MTRTRLNFALLGILALSTQAFASDQVGTLTELSGSVKLLTHPSKALSDLPEKAGTSRALFEGKYYLVEEAQPGTRVDQDNVVRTTLGAKARVVFDNGDQFDVGPGTAYRIGWDKDAAKTETHINLMYGKLRGIIAKGGPRSHLQIRTRAATMGVRGTDFFIADEGTEGTQVSILRGSVEVKADAPKAKAVEVKAGYSVDVAAKTPEHAKLSPVAELRKTTKEDLSAITQSSKIDKSKEVSAKDPEVAKKIETLEKKAVATVLTDIKAHDAKLYAQLEAKNLRSTDDVNAIVLQKAEKVAPSAPAHHKPYKSELEDLERGSYDQYFKTVE